MGLFLAASGVVGRDSDAVREAIAGHVANVGGTFEPRAGTMDDNNIGVIQEAGSGTTILYPNGFGDWDEISSHLSAQLTTPVFSFHIHDGDLWMFVAFDKGEEVSWFNPIPDYWGDLPPEEHAQWAGNADVVARLIPGVAPESIANYFRPWTEDVLDGETKAYDEDEFAMGVDWQLTDFMRRLGFVYPLDDQGNATGETFYLKIRRRRPPLAGGDGASTPPDVAPPDARRPASKPWWKFW